MFFALSARRGLFIFIIEHTVAEPFEVRVFYLFFEFLAHTDGFFRAFAFAGAVTARAFESFFDYVYYFFVGVEDYFHCFTPFLYYTTGFEKEDEFRKHYFFLA